MQHRKRKLTTQRREQKEKVEKSSSKSTTTTTTTTTSLGFVLDTRPSRRLARVAGVEFNDDDAAASSSASSSLSSSGAEDDDVAEVEDDVAATKSKASSAPSLWSDPDDARLGARRNRRRRREFRDAFGETPTYLDVDERRRRRRKEEDEEESEEEDEEAAALTVLSPATASSRLPPGPGLQYQRLADANRESVSHRRLTSVQFNRRCRVLLTASTDCRFALFEVDTQQPVFDRLHSHHLPGFPIHCASFSPDGQRIVMTSCHRSFKIFDITAEKVTHVARILGVENNCKLGKFAISPDQKYIAFVGKYGEVFIVDYRTNNRISTLRAPNSSVSCLSFTADGSQLLTAGSEGLVGRFALQHHDTRLVSQFHDEGSCDTLSLAVGCDNRLLACGSSSGVVNVYEWESVSQSPATGCYPKPWRVVQNLTTECRTLSFNSTGELLLLASPREPQAVRLLHLGSGRVVDNFPTVEGGSRGRLASVHCADFSPNSAFLALGQHTGRAALIRLQHFKQY